MSTLISAENTWALWAVMTAIAAGSICLEQRYAWASRLTGCVLALIGAMLLSNLRVIPVEAPAYDAVWSYVVPLAIPLLLFNADIRKIWRESGRLLIIFMLSGLGTVAGGFAAFFALRDFIPELYKITAMMAGTYTGGSVNLVAMADAFAASGEQVSTAIVADNLLMAVYFFVLAAVPAVRFFRKKFRHPLIDELAAAAVADGGTQKNQAQAFWVGRPVSLRDIAISVAIACAIVAVSTAIAEFFGKIIPADNFLLALAGGLLGSKYLMITTITMLLATFAPGFMGNIAGARELGTFLIHIFFTVIGVPASVYLIVTQAPLLLLFCFIMVAFNMIFSFGLGRLFNFSLEEICIASNANIGGPTTAAALAVSKGWNALIIPAILVGTLGYIIGNYYGVFMGTLLGP